jgi:hypothetical protein
MSKELEVKKNNAVSTEVADLSEWGTENVIGSDLLLAKILPMQGMSKLVMDGKAVVGEFRDSLSGEKLGSIAEPFAIIPFHVEKQWDILEPNEAGDFKWVRTIPLIENPTSPGYNDNLTWMDKETREDGKVVQVKRVRRMNFYVLIAKHIEEGSAIPYVLSFKSTSYKEGKKLLNQMYLRNRKINLPPPGFNIILGGRKDKNEDGTWIVPEYELGPKSTPEQLNEALYWFKLIKKGGVKVDESDVQSGDLNEMDTRDVGEDGTGDF